MAYLTDFLPPPADDPRTLKARELLDGNESAALVYKTTRAGATTSLCAEIMRRGETFTIVEPTNRINLETLKKAVEVSGAGKEIIPILSNENCLKNKVLLAKYPEIRQLGIIPIRRCESNDEGRCHLYDVCPITRPLRQVVGVGGYGITYAKLTALHLSEGVIAGQILRTILSVNHLIFDECHELGYPATVSVQIHPEVGTSKFTNLDYPVLLDVVAGFHDILESAEDAIEHIKGAAKDYVRKHLAIPVRTSTGAITKTRDIAVGISSLINLMINRNDYGLTIEEVALLKDMLLLCTDRHHIIHGIIYTKSDGGKQLRIFAEGTDTVFKSVVRSTMVRCTDQRTIVGDLAIRLWCTSGTIPDIGGVLPIEPVPLMFGDPLDTNSMMAVISDSYRTSDRGLRNKKQFERILNDIEQVVDRFGDDTCVLVVMSKRWHDKIMSRLKKYTNLKITWYNSDLTVGVGSDRRIWIAVGMAEKPKNAMDTVALYRVNDGDLMAMSDVLRNERVNMDTYQAWSRAKDPDAKVRSVVVALGCNAEDVRNVITWRINRKLELSKVVMGGGGGRAHYIVKGGDMIGSAIPIIKRHKTDDINELMEKWLDDGDLTPLTLKSLKDYCENHNNRELTIRDLQKGMNLGRRGLNEKDLKEFLLKNGYSAVKSPYNIAEDILTAKTKNAVKTSYDNSPLNRRDILNHYRHPLVAAAIMQHSTIGDCWRCGNHDFFGWWKRVDTATDKLEKLYVLSDRSDYNLLIDKGRTLYWSLNFFEDSITTQRRFKPEKGVKGAIVGEYKTTAAYSLGVDIDHTNGKNVFMAKTALEAAARFLIAKLRDVGIHRSYDVMFSGGGIYILIHPAITVCPTPNADRMNRERWFYLLAESYNIFINEVQQQFFESYPQYRSMVKFDALNNSKRIFKTLFSIHKKNPFACIPLDKNHPQIDFEAAHPQLADDVLESGIGWLSDYDIHEQTALIATLSQYEDRIREKNSANYIGTEITVSDTPVNIEDFPPCINTVLNVHNPPSGSTRMIAFLSSYLGQCGWGRQKAFALVLKTADQFGMDRNTAKNKFNDWFGKMRCPSCDTIRITGTHYPKMFMGELKICNPDEQCEHVYNPIRYKQDNGATEIEI